MANTKPFRLDEWVVCWRHVNLSFENQAKLSHRGKKKMVHRTSGVIADGYCALFCYECCSKPFTWIIPFIPQSKFCKVNVMTTLVLLKEKLKFKVCK